MKLLNEPYEIKTRDERRRVVTIQNLHILECTVCDHRELPKVSEDNIKVVKEMIRAGMESLARQEQAELQSKFDSKFTTVFKRLIG